MKYQGDIWGSLKQLKVPRCIVEKGCLVLKPDQLAMLMILYETAQGQQRSNISGYAQAKIGYDLLEQRSGRNKNTVSSGLNGLKGRFITWDSTRKKYARFGANEYTIINPGTGEPFEATKGQDFIFHSGMQYFTIPGVLIKSHLMRWSIAQMSSSELRLYVALCWLASGKRSGEFNATLPELKKLTGLSTIPLVETQLKTLQKKGLISALGDHITLCDPHTGERLDQPDPDPEADASNYYTAVAEKGRSSRANFNTGDPRDVEQILKACKVEFEQLGDGDLMLACPFHDDQTPSLSLDPVQRGFHCFGCGKKGTLIDIVMKLQDCNRAKAIQLVKTCMAESTGKQIEYFPPDSKALGIYSYRDRDNNLLKQVLRFPDKEFQQRRWHNGTWLYNVVGVGPCLYNMVHFRFASVVVVTEGERDADTVQRLGMFDPLGSPICGTTSGGTGSWVDVLGDDLQGKKVVIMPDADAAGERYRDAIIGSLESRGIEYRVVSFADVGAKDVSEFIEKGGTKADVVARVGNDWVWTREITMDERASGCRNEYGETDDDMQIIDP